MVHANPKDLHTTILPPVERQLDLYGENRQSDEALLPLLEGVRARLVAHGHVHVPGTREVPGHTLVNAGSLHVPADGDGAAKFALIDWHDGAWEATHRRVSYAIAGEIDAFRRSRMPEWEGIIATIEEHGYLPR